MLAGSSSIYPVRYRQPLTACACWVVVSGRESIEMSLSPTVISSPGLMGDERRAQLETEVVKLKSDLDDLASQHALEKEKLLQVWRVRNVLVCE